METKEKIETNGDVVTIWDDITPRVGLRFRRGQTLQRYQSEVVRTPDGPTDPAELSPIVERLTERAAEIWPYEFAELKEGN